MRGELQSERSAQPAAAADRNFSAFWLTTNKQHTNTSKANSYSILNADYNDDVFMNG